jgi:hypothetical protein
MVARSKSSNQRPDTLMQDRKPTARRKPLATRGRTIHSGQERRFGRAPITSGLPRQADIFGVRRHVSKVPWIGIGGSLAAPPLPHHRTYGSVYGGSRGYANALRSKIRLVLAGRWGSCTTESDSMSSRPACRASPVGADEKSSLNWIFSRLSLSRFMSYLPLLSFGPSAIVSGSAYLLTPPFGDGVPH